jgi:hypothetical protein
MLISLEFSTQDMKQPAFLSHENGSARNPGFVPMQVQLQTGLYAKTEVWLLRQNLCVNRSSITISQELEIP